MLYAENEEKQLYTESCQRNLELKFENGTTLKNDSIYMESMNLEQTLCDESELTFGKCAAACFKVRIINTPASHKGQRLIPSITSGNFTRQLGTFRVDSDNLTADKLHRDIEAYDDLYRVMNTEVSDWYNSLTFPTTLKSFRDSFFAYFKITQQVADLPNDNMAVEKTIDPGKLSGADVIQSICEINACFGSMDYDGKFRYVFLKKYDDVLYPADDLYPADELFPSDESDMRMTGSGYKQGSLQYEDFTCQQITQLQIRQEENDIGVIIGTEGNGYVIEDNFLVYGKGTAELTVIANNFLAKAQYIPYQPASLETRGKPWLQIGDYVKAIGKRDTVLFPVLHRTMSGICALMDQYEAKGTEYYSEKVNGITCDIKQLKGKSNILERSIEETKSTITDMEAGLQSQITQTAKQITAEVTRATQAEGTLSSRITQTATEVSSKVSKGSIISEINQSAESVSINAGKINLNGAVTANNNVVISTDGTITAKNANISGTITSTSATITGGSFRVEASESVGNLIELKRSGTVVQMGTDGVRAVAGEKTAKFQYSEISVLNGSSSSGLIAKLQDNGYGVSSYGWESYSDRRLKNSIEPLDPEGTADFIYSLIPSRYIYNYDNEGIYRHGLIAQQVKECMGDETWALYRDDVKIDNETYLGLNYTELIADLIATVQLQNKRITVLEEKINQTKQE